MRTNGPGIIAATFDVWETLIKDTPQLGSDRAQLRAERMAEVLRSHGYFTDARRIREIYQRTLDRLEVDVWSKHLDIGTRGQLAVFLSLLGPQPAKFEQEAMLGSLEEAYTSPIFDLPPALAPGADWALSSVLKKGLLLGLICNTGVTPGGDMRKLLDRYGVLKYFQVLTFSDEAGVRKPRSEIFRQTLDLLGVPPSQAVHVGDDAVADIAGAKGAGMKAIMVRASTPAHLPVFPDERVDDLFGVPDALERL